MGLTHVTGLQTKAQPVTHNLTSIEQTFTGTLSPKAVLPVGTGQMQYLFELDYAFLHELAQLSRGAG